MQIHELKIPNKKFKKRIGRGGKRGTFSGRGVKGQKSRAGRRIRPQIREFLKRVPKLRGYKFKSIYDKPVVMNLSDLNVNFESGDHINPETLIKNGLLVKINGNIPKVKILGGGTINKKLIVEKCLLSKSAIEKILKSGGQIKN